MSIQIYSMIDRPFGLDLVKLPDSGVGNEFVFKLPDDYFYRILSINFDLVTGVTIANRIVGLSASIGSRIAFEYTTPFKQVTSATFRYIFSAATPALVFVGVGFITAGALAPDMILPPGATIESRTTDFAVTDEYKDITIYLQKFELPK